MASTQNLASGVLASSISSSATTISVNSGSGSATTLQEVWPDPPFYATIMPATPTAGVSNSLDSEVALITAVTGTSDGSTVTMTAERGKKGTTAKAFSEGAIITNGIYAETGVFTATKSSNAYSITNVRAPMPAEGVEIFVQFDTAHTVATAPTLSINGYGSGTIKLFGPTYGKASYGVGAQIATDFVYHLVYTTVGGTAIWQVLNVHNRVQADDINVSAVTTAKIASSAVTAAKIADSAVTSDKIDFTTFTRKFEWFTRLNVGTQTITSPRGNEYSIKITNGGSGFKILSGGQKILAFRSITNVVMNSTDVADNYGVEGMALGSTIYTRVYGKIDNGVAGTMQETTSIAIGKETEAYGDLGGGSSGVKYSTQIEQTGVRVNDSYWRIFGKIASTGSASTLSFDAEYTGQSASVFGSAYQRGANTSTTVAGAGFIWVEFIESD